MNGCLKKLQVVLGAFNDLMLDILVQHDKIIRKSADPYDDVPMGIRIGYSGKKSVGTDHIDLQLAAILQKIGLKQRLNLFGAFRSFEICGIRTKIQHAGTDAFFGGSERAAVMTEVGPFVSVPCIGSQLSAVT